MPRSSRIRGDGSNGGCGAGVCAGCANDPCPRRQGFDPAMLLLTTVGWPLPSCRVFTVAGLPAGFSTRHTHAIIRDNPWPKKCTPPASPASPNPYPHPRPCCPAALPRPQVAPPAHPQAQQRNAGADARNVGRAHQHPTNPTPTLPSNPSPPSSNRHRHNSSTPGKVRAKVRAVTNDPTLMHTTTNTPSTASTTTPTRATPHTPHTARNISSSSSSTLPCRSPGLIRTRHRGSRRSRS